MSTRSLVLLCIVTTALAIFVLLNERAQHQLIEASDSLQCDVALS